MELLFVAWAAVERAFAGFPLRGIPPCLPMKALSAWLCRAGVSQLTSRASGVGECVETEIAGFLSDTRELSTWGKSRMHCNPIRLKPHGIILVLLSFCVWPLTAHGQNLARTPPMGWNSWNHFACKVSDAVVRAQADAMASNGMKAAGYEYINIDDCWQGKRDANGEIQGNDRFPDMKALADYVHSKGLKLGIYSSPGSKTCGGYEGSYGHEAQDARTYANWGVDYLKYDWCSARKVYQPSEMPAAYKKMHDALVATGRPIVFSLCEY